MRSWHALFLKGATHLKIDPLFRPPSFCATQTRVRHPGDPRGCLVLNHDTPTLLTRRNGYNSTDDLLAVLGDKTGPLYPYLSRPSVKVYFALCFKEIPALPCDSHTAATRNWLGLVDELVAAALNITAADPELNVEFVLDSGVPHSCHLQRWRPLVATSSPDPGPAFTSDNASLGYDRWGVLNANWQKGDLQRFAAGRWGKFATAPRALQVYEPCNQRDFLAASAVYVGVGVDRPTGMKFAINVDVAMSKVYTNNATGHGLNLQLPVPPAGYPAGFAPAAQLAALQMPPPSGMSTASTEASTVLVYTYRRTDGSVLYRLRSSNQSAEDSPEADLPGFAPTGSPPASLSAAGSVLLAAAGREAVMIYSFEAESESYPRIAGVHAVKFDEPLPPSATHHSFALVVRSEAGSGSGPQMAASNAYVLEVFSLGATLMQRLWVVSGTGVASAVGPGMRLATNVTVASAAVAAVSSGSSPAGTMVESVVLFEDAGAATLRLAPARQPLVPGSATDGQHAWPGPQPAIAAPIVDAGRNPRLTAAVDPTTGEAVIAAVHEDGFCANNEKRNKDAGIGSCDQAPVATPGVLVYTIGSLRSWMTLASQPSPGLSACSATLLHGAFSQGSGPSVAIVPGGGAPAFAVLHQGYSGADPEKCGMPAAVGSGNSDPAGRVVLDTWSFDMPTVST